MAKTRRGMLAGSAVLAGFGATRAWAQGTAPTHEEHPAEQPAEAARPARATAPSDAYVYIGWPQNGEVIYGTRFKIWFGTRNFGVAPAGVTTRNTGHHHLLIDTDLPKLDEPIPNNRNHLHFGLGQTETMVELPPGTHTLQLLMGDADHVPHDPPVMSRRITITVRPGRQSAPVAATQ
jgi:hypothetical protein